MVRDVASSFCHTSPLLTSHLSGAYPWSMNICYTTKKEPKLELDIQNAQLTQDYPLTLLLFSLSLSCNDKSDTKEEYNNSRVIFDFLFLKVRRGRRKEKNGGGGGEEREVEENGEGSNEIWWDFAELTVDKTIIIEWTERTNM